METILFFFTILAWAGFFYGWMTGLSGLYMSRTYEGSVDWFVDKSRGVNRTWHWEPVVFGAFISTAWLIAYYQG